MWRAFVLYILIGLGILTILGKTVPKFFPPLESLGEAYFVAIAQDRRDAAYQMNSDAFKQKVSSFEFDMLIDKYHLKNVKKTEWFFPVIEGKTGSVYGTIYYKTGDKATVKLFAILEPQTYYPEIGDVSDIPLMNKIETWKVYSLDFNPAPPNSEPVSTIR